MKDEISLSWLKAQGACQDCIDWFAAQEERDSRKLLDALIAADHWDWVNWLLPRLMDYKRYVSYAVYAAEQVIALYETEYPNNDRPRAAIEAARVCIANPTVGNKVVARAAADAAAGANAKQAAYVAGAEDAAAVWAARAAEWAARAAARAAADAAETAAWVAARTAAWAAWAEADAAWAEDAAGAADADAAWGGMRKKILAYGISLLWPEDAAKKGGNT